MKEIVIKLILINKNILKKKGSSNELINLNPKLKWIIFNNSVFNIKNFDHPGGEEIIEKTIGKF